MSITIEQCRAGRALVAWAAADLASAAEIGVASVRRFEAGQTVQVVTVDAIEKALVDAGVAFIDDGQRSTGGGPGVRLAAVR